MTDPQNQGGDCYKDQDNRHQTALPLHFAAFLSGANPNLPKSAVADLVKSHILTLKDVIDAQAAGDQARSFTALRNAASHMQMIADPLADAIVKQFPGKFTN